GYGRIVRTQINDKLKSAIWQHAFLLSARLISVVIPEGFHVGGKRGCRTMREEHLVSITAPPLHRIKRAAGLHLARRPKRTATQPACSPSARASNSQTTCSAR